MMIQKLPFHDFVLGLTSLGKDLLALSRNDHPIKREAAEKNTWFNEISINQALEAWGLSLEEDKIRKWLNPYPNLVEHWNLNEENPEKILTIGLIFAGNIPLVGFHDLLSCLVSGNKAQIKLSSQDSVLIPFITQNFLEKMDFFKGRTEFVERIHSIDRIIATGSNNSSRYFEYYFGKYPHIIRKNRHSIAILTGEESDDELRALGKDIFQYFGMGCRNVSKLWVPRGYNFVHFLDILEVFRETVAFTKYLNNVQYQNAILQLKGDHFYQNGFLYLKEDSGLSSPISVLFYEYYKPENLPGLMNALQEEIQCWVGNPEYLKNWGIPESLLKENWVAFGKTQNPELWDYADNIDTLRFLLDA